MPFHSDEKSSPQKTALLAGAMVLLNSLYADSRACELQLSFAAFVAAVERSVLRRFADSSCSPTELEEYLQKLYIGDLVLASACIQGSEAAWSLFMQEYRPYLRAAAGAIIHSGHSGTDAHELADSLYAELYGLADGPRSGRSLFRYYHGRSSLRTWLRAILAQRHIDRLRENRRLQPYDPADPDGACLSPTDGKILEPSIVPDPHRQRYLGRFSVALSACLQRLVPSDRERLELYYVHQWTLADIGKKLGEHESSVSRNLERIRRSLRSGVEDFLRCPPALSEAEILLCFQYAAEDVPIDFRELFPERNSTDTDQDRKEPS